LERSVGDFVGFGIESFNDGVDGGFELIFVYLHVEYIIYLLCSIALIKEVLSLLCSKLYS
jgi:hypothetical protein